MSNFNFGNQRKKIIDLVFPKLCFSCGQEGEWLCPLCQESVKIRPDEYCPICRRDLFSHKCPGSPLTNLWALSNYGDLLIEDLVQKLKYNYLVGLVEDVWSGYLNDYWLKFGSNFSHGVILVPVPLHQKKILLRGFNQSALIAQELARISNCQSVENLLKRAKYNEPQVGLSGSRRIENVKGIFEVDYRAVSDWWGQEILLIDDVYTTGSTMNECALTLKSVGFTKISGLVLAIN